MRRTATMSTSDPTRLIPQHISNAADALSAGAIIGAIFGYLPTVAALLGLTWYAIQIWESDTVQRLLSNCRTKKVARLRAKAAQLEEKLKTTVK